VLDLKPPADTLVAVITTVRGDQLNDPTPCENTSDAQLIAHALGLAVAFRDAARKIDGPTTSTAPGSVPVELPARWRELAGPRLSELAEAWRDPSAWEGMTKAGGITMPGDVAGIVANNELVLHGWDLAVATGSPFEVAAENLASSWEMVSQTPDTPQARQGLFGPVIGVADSAPLLDRVLGGAGRDPRWAPPIS
jgi:uncharacterized protein (TIGR03086 family)